MLAELSNALWKTKPHAKATKTSFANYSGRTFEATVKYTGVDHKHQLLACRVDHWITCLGSLVLDHMFSVTCPGSPVLIHLC